MNKLKSLYPSILLIAIYFIAEEFLGVTIGMLCALVLGLGEFIYTRIKEKRYDKVILLTTLLFCLPGLLNLIAKDSFLTPFLGAIPETALCILLGLLTFSTNTLPNLYRKTIQLTDYQQRVIRGFFLILFYLLTLHTLLLYTSILYTNTRIITFVSGPLLYIIIGCFVGFIIIRKRIMAHKYSKEEWLPIVNEKGEVKGQAPRSICHSGSKLLHPVVHLHIFDTNNNILLQKRSMTKKLLPGKWDTAVGGHIGINEKVEDALKRETFEELGITRFEAAFMDSYIWENDREKELIFSFLCTKHSRLNVDNNEVDEVRFWSKTEIENNIKSDLFTPNFIHEYNKYLQQLKSSV